MNIKDTDHDRLEVCYIARLLSDVVSDLLGQNMNPVDIAKTLLVTATDLFDLYLTEKHGSAPPLEVLIACLRTGDDVTGMTKQ